MRKPAYGMNDAPRRWWNRIDQSLRGYGLVPARADRCVYILYAKQQEKAHQSAHAVLDKPSQKGSAENQSKDLAKLLPICHDTEALDTVLEYLLDPITGSPAKGCQVEGAVVLHVDDLLFTGSPELEKKEMRYLRKDYMVGSESQDEGSFLWSTRSLGRRHVAD